jgi:thioredoxin-like negative regulator of GroEL
MTDPWGVVEAQLLLCQSYLAAGKVDSAKKVLKEVQAAGVKEPEPKQHALLTEAWLAQQTGDVESAQTSLDAAASVFSDRTRAGDHTPHLLGRLSRLGWPEGAQKRIDAWRALVNDRTKRNET